MNFLTTGTSPNRMGNQHPNIVPYEVFPVADGDVIIAAGNDRQYRALCDVLGRTDLREAEDYKTNGARVAARDVLVPILKDETRKHTKADLLAALEAALVPASPINSVGEALDDPQIRARGMQVAPENVPGVRTPITFGRSELALERTAPRLGEHDDLVKSSGWSVGANDT